MAHETPKTPPTRPGRLLAIPLSHYCEKARWALERAGVPYREEAHLPLFQVIPALRTGGRRTVPVLVTEDAGVLNDSSLIVEYADRFLGAADRLLPTESAERDEVLPLARTYDEALGPHTRRLVYHHMLPEKALVLETMAQRAPAHELFLLRSCYPLAGWALRKLLRIDEEGARRSLAKVREVLDAADARLADGRRYLALGRLTAADLSLAALLAPLVLPPEGYGVRLPPPERCPPALRALVEETRLRPSGRHTLRLYAEERTSRAPSAAQVGSAVGAGA